MDRTGQPSASNPTEPTMASVVEEVYAAKSLKVWALRLAQAVQEGRLTEAQAKRKTDLLNQAAKLLEVDGIKPLSRTT